MSKSFSKWYDFFMSPLEKRRFKAIRRDLIDRASGSVLEVGSGTGINFPFYHDVEKVTAIEPSEDMIERSQKRRGLAAVPVEVLKGTAERLPFSDNVFDTVIVTLALCTIPNPEAAILEIKRVCKPNGKVLVFEHVKMDQNMLAKLQEWLTPFWKKICDGCCLNRNTVELIQANQLEILDKQSYYNGLFVQVEAKNKK